MVKSPVFNDAENHIMQHPESQSICDKYEREYYQLLVDFAKTKVMLGMAEKELRKSYNEMYKLAVKHGDIGVMDAIFKDTNIPTNKEMQELLRKDMIMKVSDRQNEFNKKRA